MGTCSILMWGVVRVILCGVMNGGFTLPMRYLGPWSRENMRVVFIGVACLTRPIPLAFATVAHLLEALAGASLKALVSALVKRLAWGLGAIMFGQG